MHRRIALVTVLLILAMSALPAAAARADAGTDFYAQNGVPPATVEETATGPAALIEAGQLTSYTSPRYGYTLRYDPVVWRIRASDRDPTDPYDELHLTNGVSSVMIIGNPTYGADQLPDCVADYATLRDQTDGVTAHTAVPGTSKQEAGRAVATYRFTDQSVDYVDHIDCRTLGNVTVVIVHTVAAAASDEEGAARDALLAGLTASPNAGTTASEAAGSGGDGIGVSGLGAQGSGHTTGVEAATPEATCTPS